MNENAFPDRSATAIDSGRQSYRELVALSPGIVGHRAIQYRDPGENEILIKTIMSGVSLGTESRRLQGRVPLETWDDATDVFLAGESGSRWPMSLGYENLGLIVQCGSGVRPSCLGRLIWTPSAHATHTYADFNQVRHGIVQSELDKERLPLLTFVARTRIALAAIHDSQLRVGDRVGVVGCGIIGYIAAQLAKLGGAEDVFIFDIENERLTAATATGLIPVQVGAETDLAKVKIDLGQPGLDIIIESSGTYEGLRAALSLAGREGTVVTISTYHGPAHALDLGREWSRNRLDLRSSMSVNGRSSRNTSRWNKIRLERIALRFVCESRISFSNVALIVRPFDQASEIFDVLPCTKGLTGGVLSYDQ